MIPGTEAERVPEHEAGVVTDGDVVVALTESHQDLVRRADILHSWSSRSWSMNSL